MQQLVQYKTYIDLNRNFWITTEVMCKYFHKTHLPNTPLYCLRCGTWKIYNNIYMFATMLRRIHTVAEVTQLISARCKFLLLIAVTCAISYEMRHHRVERGDDWAPLEVDTNESIGDSNLNVFKTFRFIRNVEIIFSDVFINTFLKP